MSRRICVITGTRAEYGLLRGLLDGLRADPVFELQIVATGMHLSPEFGLTYREIEADGFRIDRKVEILLSSDTAIGVGTSTGLAVIRFTATLDELRPHLVLLLGDRFEILAAATAALIAGVPIAHVHGGEITEGAVDDAMRHAITKMSHLHFVAVDAYRQRVIQLGEQPERVHCVGGLGVDAIARVQLLDRTALVAEMGHEFMARNLLITFHPETLNESGAGAQMAELLAALAPLTDVGLIFTLPNADAGGRELISIIRNFAVGRPNVHIHTSLGSRLYLSCMSQCDGVVGNSSSGLLEAPTLGKGTVNIGERQKGRLQADSVINCRPEQGEIAAALHKLLSPEFASQAQATCNPYGDVGASARIVAVLKQVELQGLLQKRFHDVAVTGIGEKP
jgi:GDP/UDP-N,N'-diacetylbacillosamine 2-epimerase (hydrolysing)